jgi:hypothetical protein
MISAKPNTPIASDDEVDAVRERREAEGEALLMPVLTSVPIRSEQQAEHDHADRP